MNRSIESNQDAGLPEKFIDSGIFQIGGFDRSEFKGDGVLFHGGGDSGDQFPRGKLWWDKQKKGLEEDEADRIKREDRKMEQLTGDEVLPIEDERFDTRGGILYVKYKRGGKWGKPEKVRAVSEKD